MSRFVHLHVHSHYSLLDGLSKIDELVAQVRALGMEAVALTDHGNLYGAVEFYKKAKKAGVRPILGCEAYVAPRTRFDKQAGVDDVRAHLILLAKNETGWKNLIQLVTKAHMEGFYYKPRVDRELIAAHHEGLICLSGCLGGEIGRALKRGRYDEAKATAEFYQSVFGADYYLEIQPHAPEIHEGLKKLSQELSIPLVATQDAHYVHEDDKTVHDILLAVQTNAKLEEENRFSMKQCDLHLRSPEEMGEIFKDMPEALEASAKIAEMCSVTLELGKVRLPRFPVPEGQTSMGFLRALVEERLPLRYPESTPAVEARKEMELGVIEKTGYADYFLIVQDLIQWARAHGIVSNTRGSAPGSMVSYVLGITKIDPLKYDLIFERFLNPDRIQMPDIDIDFTDVRRDEVIAYVREKYGEECVAQIITFGTMLARAAIRDATRALGLPYALGDQIAKLIPFNTSMKDAVENTAELKQLFENDANARRVIEAAIRLEGAVRHASVHACGVVISAEPLPEIVPLQYAPQGEQTVLTQFEMHSIEDLGLLKMDFLGLRNLTIIEKALRLIKELHGIQIDVDALPLDDPKTFALYQAAETTGVFQLESGGMRRYLKELKPTELEDIIAMIALYRPGPMELIPLYIRRKHGKELVHYLHPKLEPILKTTHGVGIYQEQMMRIARDLAGFTLAEADTLRKAIGKKIKALLDEQQERLVQGMIRNGIDEKTARDIWELFPPFARYGFNRSHAASYGIISFQTAYLKAHYPVEFMTSLLNVSGHDVDRVNFLIQEAKRLGIHVLPPDINASFEDFAVDTSAGVPTIRFGLFAIKNIGANIVKEVIDERRRGGPYQDFADVLHRVQHRDMNKKSLESLIKAGAFDSFGLERNRLLSNIEEIIRFNQAVKKLSNGNQHNLFGGSIPKSSLRLKDAAPADTRTLLAWEKELLGLYLTDHPFNTFVLDNRVQKIASPIRTVRETERGVTPPVVKVAGVVVLVKKILTKKGDPMLFVIIEDLTGGIEIVVFPKLYAKNPEMWSEGNGVLLAGQLSWKEDEPKILCEEARAL